jgi:2-keto-4-pentenoate hydratase/2-oxohepta-3-ene-1,7-dioic acid hydratase in catechol pathway
MRFCRFKAAEKVAYGIVEGPEVVELRGSPFDRYDRTAIRRPLDRVKLLVPCTPRMIYTPGINYTTHAKEAAEKQGKEFVPPPQPVVDHRSTTALLAHNEAIALPKDSSGEVHYEGEVVTVIGKQARSVPEDKAQEYILGYTIGNDLTDRAWHRADGTNWRSKNADTFKPVGPWIDTSVNLNLAYTAVSLNGKKVSEFTTNAMLFKPAKVVSFISRYVTLYPGDLIFMGTDGHTEPVKPGDTIEIEIRGLGVLRNSVVAEA